MIYLILTYFLVLTINVIHYISDVNTNDLQMEKDAFLTAPEGDLIKARPSLKPCFQ